MEQLKAQQEATELRRAMVAATYCNIVCLADVV